MNDTRLLTGVLGVGLILAVLCNGASFYLRKIGVLEREAYAAHMEAVHCKKAIPVTPNRLAVLNECARLVAKWDTVEGRGKKLLPSQMFGQYLYKTFGPEILLKFVKDVFCGGFVVLAGVLIVRRRHALPAFRAAWPLYLLLGSFCFGLLWSLMNHPMVVAMAGGRSFAIAAIALVGGGLAFRPALFAPWTMRLLVAEFFLLPVEFLYGLPVNDPPKWGPFELIDRVSGTLIRPNSLGVFAIVSFLFCYAFSAERSFLRILGVATAVAIIAAGSGTGAAALLSFALLGVAKKGLRFIPGKRTIIAVTGLFVLGALLFFLPRILGRHRLQESLGGRVTKLHGIFLTKAPHELLLGSGLGLNSGAVLNLVGQGYVEQGSSPDPLGLRNLDSTVTSLVMQVGVAGLLAFYGAILWAALRHSAARPFYLVVTISSLTLNIIEFFPVNFLLGISLAYSASIPGPVSQPGAESPFGIREG